jgi:hypothetical protein
MKIKVLGTGCAKCKRLYAEAEKAIGSRQGQGVNVMQQTLADTA